MSRKITAEELYTIAEHEGPVTALAYFGRNIRVTIPMTSALRAESIDVLNLSVRSHNALMRAGAPSIGAVCDLISRESGIAGVRNLGRKSISEIKTVIFVYSYESLSEKYRRAFWAETLLLNEPDRP